MSINLALLEATLDRAVPAVCPAAQLVIRWRDRTVHDRAYGWLDPDTRRWPTSRRTRFDLASVTKLFTVTTFMTLVEAGQVALDQSVGSVLPTFAGLRPVQPYENPAAPDEYIVVADGGSTVDTADVTFRHLLTHSGGLPPWRPLFRQRDGDAAHQMALTTYFACQPGGHLLYSDIGLILLGLAIERLTGSGLDVAIRDRATAPLALNQTGFVRLSQRPTLSEAQLDVAPTELCTWRQRRIIGQVHDENAYSLDGVAGHAGLFSTAADVARLGQMYLNGGRPLLLPETVAEMTRLQVEEDDRRRGLGFVRWTVEPAANGPSFCEGTFGHTGFTGTSLWIDPTRQLVVAFLTNEVYHGRVDRKIAQLRSEVHGALLAAVDNAAGVVI